MGDIDVPAGLRVGCWLRAVGCGVEAKVLDVRHYDTTYCVVIVLGLSILASGRGGASPQASN